MNGVEESKLKGLGGGAVSPPTEGIASVNPTPDKVQEGAEWVDFESLLEASERKAAMQGSSGNLLSEVSKIKSTIVKKDLFRHCEGASEPNRRQKRSSEESQISNTSGRRSANKNSKIVAELEVEDFKGKVEISSREVIEIEDEETLLAKAHKSRVNNPYKVIRTEAVKTVMANPEEPSKTFRRRSSSGKKKSKAYTIPHPEGKQDLERAEYITKLMKQMGKPTSEKKNSGPAKAISREPLCIIQKPSEDFREQSRNLISLLKEHLQEIELLKKQQELHLSQGIASSTLQGLLGKRAPQASVSGGPETPNPGETTTATLPNPPTAVCPPPRTLYLDSASSLLSSAIQCAGSSDLWRRILQWTLLNCRESTLCKIEGRLGVRLKKRARERVFESMLNEKGSKRVLRAVGALKSYAERVMTNAERSLLGGGAGQASSGLQGWGMGGVCAAGDTDENNASGDKRGGAANSDCDGENSVQSEENEGMDENDGEDENEGNEESEEKEDCGSDSSSAESRDCEEEAVSEGRDSHSAL